MHTPSLSLVSRSVFPPPPPDPDLARVAGVFRDALAGARARGAAPSALVSHLVPLVRLASVHGTPGELGGHLDELHALGEGAPLIERVALSLARSGRRAAAQRLRAVARLQKKRRGR